MNPSLNDIRYFLKVCEHRNISKAAQVLGVQQSTVSAAIMRLEKALGVSVFMRSQSGVKATRQGEELKLKASRLEHEWVRMFEGLKKNEDHPTGIYSIGCHALPANYFLPRLFPALSHAYPEVELKLIHDHSLALNEKVIRGELDFAIVSTILPQEDLVVRPLIKDRIGFWSIHRTVKPSEETLIYVPEFKLSLELAHQLNKKKIFFKKTIVTSSVEVSRELAASGVGVAILPELSLQSPFYQSKLRVLEGFPIFPGQQSLIYHSQRHRSPAGRALARSLCDLLMKSV